MDCLLARARLLYLRRLCKHSKQALFLLLTMSHGTKRMPWITQLVSDLALLRASTKFHKIKIPGQNADLSKWMRVFSDRQARETVVNGIFFTKSCDDKYSTPSGLRSVNTYICIICTVGIDGTRPSFASQRALESHQRAKHKKLSDLRFYVGADGKYPVCKTTFNSRIRCLAHLSDRRRTACSDQIKAGSFRKIAATRVAQLDIEDRTARREAQRAGHSHLIAQKPAIRRDGKAVGRVSK